MKNDSSLNARQASIQAGKTGDNYQVETDYKTRVLPDWEKTRVFLDGTSTLYSLTLDRNSGSRKGGE